MNEVFYLNLQMGFQEVLKKSVSEAASLTQDARTTLEVERPELQMCDHITLQYTFISIAEWGISALPSQGDVRIEIGQFPKGVTKLADAGANYTATIIAYPNVTAQGLISIAMASKRYQSIQQRIVYADSASASKLSDIDDTIEDNIPADQLDSLGIKTWIKRDAYGLDYTHFMSFKDLDSFANKYSLSFRNNAGPWIDSKEDMMRKTALKAALRRAGNTGCGEEPLPSVLRKDMSICPFDQTVAAGLYAAIIYPDNQHLSSEQKVARNPSLAPKKAARSRKAKSEDHE